ncbi:MAG: RimK/LysX family protein [Candidatus Scalindua sp.]|nr:RimK/LysX family protein [Candidatus Scalindua sp.]
MNIKQTINFYLPLTFLLLSLLNGCAISNNVDEDKLVTKKDLDTKKITPENEGELPVYGSVIESVKKENITLKKSSSNGNKIIEKKIDEKKTETNSETSNDSDNKNVTINNKRELPVYGYVEHILLCQRNLNLKAKLDSGSKTSSLTAIDIVEFERDGDEWVRFFMIDPVNNEKIEFEKKIERHVKIKQHGTEDQRRPVVMMEVRLGTIHIKREFSLISRNKSIYQVILGRNFMNGVLLIDVSQTFLSIARSE